MTNSISKITASQGVVATIVEPGAPVRGYAIRNMSGATIYLHSTAEPDEETDGWPLEDGEPLSLTISTAGLHAVCPTAGLDVRLLLVGN